MPVVDNEPIIEDNDSFQGQQQEPHHDQDRPPAVAVAVAVASNVVVVDGAKEEAFASAKEEAFSNPKKRRKSQTPGNAVDDNARDRGKPNKRRQLVVAPRLKPKKRRHLVVAPRRTFAPTKVCCFCAFPP